MILNFVKIVGTIKNNFNSTFEKNIYMYLKHVCDKLSWTQIIHDFLVKS